MCDGAGTDIVSVARIAALIEARGAAYLERWFTPAEIDYCSGKAEPGPGTSPPGGREGGSGEGAAPALGRTVALALHRDRDRRARSASVRLSGTVGEAADEAGVRDIRISLAHCDEYATAVALASWSPTDVR